MKKRTWIIGLLVVFAGSVILFGFAIWYYVDWCTRLREVPTKLIRSTFKYVTNRELPEKTDGLRAIYCGGREPAIFVRFETDSEGVAYILEKFGGRGVETNTFDVDSKKRHSVLHVHGMLSYYQEKIGVHIFDWKDIKSGLELKYSAGIQPSYEIVIDEQHKTIYIFAYWT